MMEPRYLDLTDRLSSGARLAEPRITRAITWTFVASLIALFVALPSLSGVSPQFTPDAWTAMELARTVGGDFFRANTVREYSTVNPYSSALAPLWPVVVALFARMVDNIYASYLAAFLSYAAFAAAAEVFARRAFGARGIGVLSALLLLRFLGVREELGSGRSIPLYLAELALLGASLVGLESARRRRSAMVGLLAGAMVMTRFDALPGALLLIAGAPLIGVSRERFALLVAGFAAAISPWIVYSLAHFHTVFATDNRAVALALDPYAFVFDYHLRPQLTLFDDPVTWLGKLVPHVRAIGKAFLLSMAESVFAPILLVLAIGARYSGQGDRDSASRAPSREFRLFTLVTVAPMAGYLVTGYWDHRYFSASIWLAELFALARLAKGSERLYRTAVIVLLMSGGLLSLAVVRFAAASSPLAVVRRELDASQVEALALCLRRAGARPADGVVFAGPDVVNRFKFGALARWRVLPIPSNWERLGRLERNAFLRAFRASYVVDSRISPSTSIAQRDTFVDCAVPLRRITSARP